ncbi:hypothetical protein PH210_23630 [Paenibacillus sp. BSR1-1]|uniref:hypothetical protein n=1 Tax=Paenibacillus sp. BSR1-1 TaxID=3020845 RepID=UPI0025B0A4DD|nr:hypothetical protein [Paenibacillus sp. BSR1-1]MDN3019168.1 hypothetical protein [Paenibacillus sp. BSR1-1]
MRQTRQYKSPNAAMLWSVVLPGFGQLYNKDYLVGFALIALEFLVNLNANLNLSLITTFVGDMNSSHHSINYRWGLFYPSIYGYAIWQAYNAARANNEKLVGKEGPMRTYFSGFFLGLVIGMDFGLFWHDGSFITQLTALRFLDYPVVNGIVFGLLMGILGHIMENKVYRKQKAAVEKS